MFGDGSLTFREFATREPLPLARVHDAVLDFLRGRDDLVLAGAHAVNAYIDEPRMSDDVDMLSPRAPELAKELRAYLEEQFSIAVRVRPMRGGGGYRIDQVRRPENRHLADVDSVDELPRHQVVEGVRVLAPAELIASKLFRMVGRWRTPDSMVDWADLARLLLVFPDLKVEEGQVAETLRAAGASDKVMAAWKDLVAQEILPEDEDDGY
jgi:Nucleotidyl transferase AbiEii toxin, Type IV TA system